MMHVANRLAPPLAGLMIAAGACLAPAAPALAAEPAGQTRPGPTPHYYASGCLTARGLPLPAAVATGCQRVDVTAGIATVVMRHEGAMLNCCAEVSVEVVVDGTTIRFLEREAGEPCHCECPYNLAADVENVPAGEYTVEVRSPADDLIWVQFVEVFPASPQVSFGYSPCPLSPTGEAPPPPRVEIESCAGKVTVKHRDARVNCCLDLDVQLVAEPGRIVLTEVDTGEPCFCTCVTDIMIGVDDLTPGRYLVDLVDVAGSLAGSDVVEVTGPRTPARRAGTTR